MNAVFDLYHGQARIVSVRDRDKQPSEMRFRDVARGGPAITLRSDFRNRDVVSVPIAFPSGFVEVDNPFVIIQFAVLGYPLAKESVSAISNHTRSFWVLDTSLESLYEFRDYLIQAAAGVDTDKPPEGYPPEWLGRDSEKILELLEKSFGSIKDAKTAQAKGLSDWRGSYKGIDVYNPPNGLLYPTWDDAASVDRWWSWIPDELSKAVAEIAGGLDYVSLSTAEHRLSASILA